MKKFDSPPDKPHKKIAKGQGFGCKNFGYKKFQGYERGPPIPNTGKPLLETNLVPLTIREEAKTLLVN